MDKLCKYKTCTSVIVSIVHFFAFLVMLLSSVVFSFCIPKTAMTTESVSAGHVSLALSKTMVLVETSW